MLVLALAACGERGPTGPPPRLVLSADSIVLPAIGAHATVEARVGTRWTDTPALRLVSEDRWISDRPVLDAAWLRTSRILADGPGTALVEVRALNAAPGTVFVDVAPGRPVALEVEPERASPGDTVAVRGYRMDAVDSSGVEVGGVRVRVVGQDSATLRFLAPAVEQPMSCAGSAEAPLVLPGATDWAGVTYLRPRVGELDVPVGKVVRLDAAERQCLRLVPLRDYALAYLDTRETGAAARGALTQDWSAKLPLGIEDLSAVTAAADQVIGSTFPTNVRAMHSDEHRAGTGRASSAADSSTCAVSDLAQHDSAWTPGDRFRFCYSSNAIDSATVVLVRDPLVIAVLDRDSAIFKGGPLPADVDSAASYLAAGGLTFMQDVFGTTLYTSAPNSGQFLIVYDPGTVSTSSQYSSNGLVYGYVTAGTDYTPESPGAVLQVFAHELTHDLQLKLAYAETPLYSPPWAIEGGADFLSYQVVRRYIGVPFLSNWDGWRSAAGSPAFYAAGAATGWGFGLGYGPAADFMRDLTSRLVVDGGLPYDQALHLVLTRSLQGWYGEAAPNASPGGLAAAVQPYLGTDWNPEDALLTWTLSQAVDELTGNSELQNRQFYQTSYCAVELADTLAVTGRPPVDCPADAVIIPGQGGYTEQRIVGSTSYFYIHDAIGATLRLDGDSLAWDIVRYR